MSGEHQLRTFKKREVTQEPLPGMRAVGSRGDRTAIQRAAELALVCTAIKSVGLSPTVFSNGTATPFSGLAWKKWKPCMENLLHVGDQSALHYAARAGRTNVANAILNSDDIQPIINIQDVSGETAFWAHWTQQLLKLLPKNVTMRNGGNEHRLQNSRLQGSEGDRMFNWFMSHRSRSHARSDIV